MLALDCETTGLDLRHGAKPYFVSICNSEGMQTWYEWDVNPITREPDVPKEDIESLAEQLSPYNNEDASDGLILQNPKFDVKALSTICEEWGTDWVWELTYDTLLAAHLLDSKQPKDLTSLCIRYLGVNLQPYEDRIKKATQQARTLVKREFPDWRTAQEGLPEMPSEKGKIWKADMWLPRAVAKKLHYKRNHPWRTVLRDYGNPDTAVLNPLFKVMTGEIERRGLTAIYKERLKLLPVVYKMEDNGVTINRGRLNELTETYREETDRAGRICVNIAKRYGSELELPKSGNNKSLTDCVFNKLKLPVVAVSKKTGEPSLNKTVIEHYQATLDPRDRRLAFINNLSDKRKRDTALGYMEGYERFWLPLEVYNAKGEQLWFLLNPSLNPTGTDTLRWSSSNPNEQNISKKEGFNLRYCFGPAPGRIWYSLDANNIELRLPAYEAGETKMIDLFERPNDPPYYGSYHMLIFATLHPKFFAKYGMECKKRFGSTWYQWTKNGDFAIGYGSVEESGTADRAYHVPGAFKKVKKLFRAIHGPGGLNDKMIAHAEKHGYVETMPDKTVNPKRGYPLECTRTDYGRIKPTVPLNYHVQGTACWWMGKAMVRCQNYLDTLDGYKMVMQVHDELVFDFPVGDNKKHLHKIKKLMEQGGEDIGVPTPVSCESHPNNWSEGEAV